MNIWGFIMFKRISILLATFAFSISAHATLIDFTDSSWSSISGTTSYSKYVDTIGTINLSSVGGSFTFNSSSWEQNGCADSAGGSLLECNGDGIGINDDEIHQGGQEIITVSFLDGPVNINNIYLLDLFIEGGGAEVALISSNGTTTEYTSESSAIGGFYDTGFYGSNITSIIFEGNLDAFSDYALAGIEISPVPIPGAAILFGSALLGFFGFKRRRTA